MLHFPTKQSLQKFSLADSSRGFVKPLVLVVEDQEINADLLRELLHKVGICCAWARNGAEAVEMFLEASPGTFQAILMDIKMPVMNGLEATKIIRESNTEIPIIMQTAYAFSSDKENAMNAGATEVLVKPITLSILRTTLSKYLPDLQW